MNRNLFVATIVGIVLFFLAVIGGILVLADRGDSTAQIAEKTQQVSKENCLRIHTLTTTLDTMIADSAGRLRKLGEEGTLTEAQVRRGLDDVIEQRRQLGPADCPARHGLPPDSR